MAKTSQRRPSAAARRRGGCQLLKSDFAKSGDLSAAHEPSRAMRSWIARANEISFPLNQRPTTVVAATMKSSDPIPRRKRPIIIPAHGVPGRTAGRTAIARLPAAPMAPKRTAEAATPIRSIRTPPAMSVRSAATL